MNDINERICTEAYVPESELEAHIDEIDFILLLQQQKLGMPFINRYKDRIPMFWVLRTQKVSVDYLEANIGNLSVKERNALLPFISFSESVLRKYANEWDWADLCRFQRVSEGFVIEFFPKIVWGALPYMEFSDTFLKTYEHFIPNGIRYRNFCMPQGYAQEFDNYLVTEFYE